MNGSDGTSDEDATMNPIDIAVIVAYLLGMAGMGFWFMRRNKDADAYFKAGGKLPWWVVSLSIYATMFSSITFISVPAMSFSGDMTYFVISFGIPILAVVTVRWYLPFFRRLNLTSAYEYLETRFNLQCRLFASAAFILFMVARTAIVAYLPALAIAAVTGIDINVARIARSSANSVAGRCSFPSLVELRCRPFVRKLLTSCCGRRF